jgi:hypothetical protein
MSESKLPTPNLVGFYSTDEDCKYVNNATGILYMNADVEKIRGINLSSKFERKIGEYVQPAMPTFQQFLLEHRYLVRNIDYTTTNDAIFVINRNLLLDISSTGHLYEAECSATLFNGCIYLNRTDYKDFGNTIHNIATIFAQHLLSSTSDQIII